MSNDSDSSKAGESGWKTMTELTMSECKDQNDSTSESTGNEEDAEAPDSNRCVDDSNTTTSNNEPESNHTENAHKAFRGKCSFIQMRSNRPANLHDLRRRSGSQRRDAHPSHFDNLVSFKSLVSPEQGSTTCLFQRLGRMMPYEGHNYTLTSSQSGQQESREAIPRSNHAVSSTMLSQLFPHLSQARIKDWTLKACDLPRVMKEEPQTTIEKEDEVSQDFHQAPREIEAYQSAEEYPLSSSSSDVQDDDTDLDGFGTDDSSSSL